MPGNKFCGGAFDSGKFESGAFLGAIGMSATPSWSPADIGLKAWFRASEGFTNTGGSASWVDRIAGYTLTNAELAGVDYGLPVMTSPAGHNDRPAINFNAGALHGAIPASDDYEPFTIVLVCSGDTSQLSMLATTDSSALWNTASWALTTNDAPFIVGNRRTTWSSYVPDELAPVMYQWNVVDNANLGSVAAYVDGAALAGGVSNSATRDVHSNTGYLIVGATANGAAALTYSGVVVEEIMIIAGSTISPEDKLLLDAWWVTRKTEGAAPSVPGPDVYDITMQYGQSNMVGQDTSAVTIASNFGNVMFASGVSTWLTEVLVRPRDRTTTTALVENDWESGAAFGADYLTFLQIADAAVSTWQDLPTRNFVINPAVSGRKISKLSEGGSEWARTLLDLGAMKTACGGTSIFKWIDWMQGFSDSGDLRGIYAPKLTALYDQILTATAVDYPTAAPKLLIAQHSTHRTTADLPFVALDQLAVADAQAYAEIAFPTYSVPWANDTHLNEIGQRMKGAMLAKVKRDIENGGHTPVRVDTILTWTATEITATITGGTGVYTMDTTFVAAAVNSGFDIHSSTDVLEDIITGVSLVGNVVTITLSALPSVGSKLTYGWGRAGMAAPVDTPIPLGNLRDDDARTATIDAVVHNLHNYAVISEIS